MEEVYWKSALLLHLDQMECLTSDLREAVEKREGEALLTPEIESLSNGLSYRAGIIVGHMERWKLWVEAAKEGEAGK